MSFPGRHGSMASSELEHIIVRNSQFLAAVRSGPGDGCCGLHNAISGRFLGGIGGGRIPEHTVYRKQTPSCVRGWRHILYDLLHKRHVRPTDTIRILMGDEDVRNALDYGLRRQPPENPEPDMQCHRGVWI